MYQHPPLKSKGASSTEPAELMSTPSEQVQHSDPAPTRHEPDTQEEQVLEKGKYEASQPYRSPKGNRFS